MIAVQPCHSQHQQHQHRRQQERSTMSPPPLPLEKEEEELVSLCLDSYNDAYQNHQDDYLRICIVLVLVLHLIYKLCFF